MVSVACFCFLRLVACLFVCLDDGVLDCLLRRVCRRNNLLDEDEDQFR